MARRTNYSFEKRQRENKKKKKKAEKLERKRLKKEGKAEGAVPEGEDAPATTEEEAASTPEGEA